MSVSRSQLGRGPAIVTFGGATLFTRDDLVPEHSPVWKPVNCSLHGAIDQYKEDFVIRLPLMLFGLWSNVSVLFPSYLLNPTVGAAIFDPSTDAPLVILARNGDKITYANAAITALAGLYCGVDSELFAAAVEVSCIIKNNANPEDAGAYFTRLSGQVYSETTFSTANFKKVRFTAAWGAVTGFTSFIGQRGFNVSWKCDAQPDPVDGYGTVSMFIGEGSVMGNVRTIPIGPTQAQIDTAQATAAAHGALLGTGAADLTLTGANSGPAVVMKNAGMVKSSTAFGVKPLRIGEVAWETTRGFTTGAAQAVSTVT